MVVSGASDEELGAVRRLFEAWERAFSRFRPDSELNLVNRSRSQVLVVSELFARAVRTALGAAGATDGLVDPTLGRAIEAAGYDADFSLLTDDDERPLGPAARGSCFRTRVRTGSTNAAYRGGSSKRAVRS